MKRISNILRSINWVYKLALRISARFSKRFETKNLKTFFLFIGYPRSGHTLVGALLDAHPNVLCSIEANALSLFKKGYSRNLLFYFLQKRNDVFVNKLNSIWTGYSYEVEGAWQGDITNVAALGDKKGAGTTKLLIQDEELLARFETEIGLPLKIIHVVRNPFDNIATIMLRAKQKGKKCDLVFFNERVEYYRRHISANQKVIENYPNRILTIYHEELIRNPGEELVKIINFLGVQVDQDYIQKCVELVYASPNKTRFKIEWPGEMKEKVNAVISEVDFLQRYTWDS